ncbi:MAG: IPT/TIG domain-containing protein, partial [Myxococcota bacterium]
MRLLLLLSVGCSWRSEPCPTVDGVLAESQDAPGPLYNGDAQRLVVSGTAFSALPSDLRGGAPLLPVVTVGDVDLVDVVWTPDTLLGTLPVQDPPLPPGTYDLTVTNPAGCAFTLPDAVAITDTPPPFLDDSIRVDAITPPFAWTGQATAVTISGDGFVSTPRVYLAGGAFAPLTDVELDQLAFIDTGSLAGVVPPGVPVGGPYDVVVLNPNGGYNVLADALTVTAEPPPDVLSVLPQAGTTQEDTEIVVTGESFDAGASVLLVNRDGVETAASVTVIDEGRIEATVPSTSMGVGAYLVRVRNSDGSYDDYAAFVNRNPSAKLGTDGAWAESAPLNVARAGGGLLASTDSLGRGWLWAVGGDDGSAPLTSVERAQVDVFGTISSWAVLGSALSTARADAAYAVHDGFVWAIGGDDGTGALDTVERAAILDGEAGVRPDLDGDPLPGGMLEPGTWYYRVSAVMADDDPWNPGGETLASEVEVVRLEIGEGAVGLVWTPVPGAVGYHVYRTDAVNGSAGAEHRVAEGVVETAWVDDGAPAGTIGFVPDGGLGRWVEVETRLPAPRSHAVAVVAEDADGAARVWLVGGSDGGGPADTVWVLEDDGTWTEAGVLAGARMDHGAFV